MDYKERNTEISNFPTSMLKAGTFGAVKFDTMEIDYFVLVPANENFRMVYKSGGFDILGTPTDDSFVYDEKTGYATISEIVYLDNDVVSFDDAETTYENKNTNDNNWFKD